MSGEFIENLKGALLNTLSADKVLRQSAEDALQSYLGVPNAFTGFLHLACQTQERSNAHLRMAALLALKNNVRHFWSTGTGSPSSQNPAPRWPMSQEEKEQVKLTIVEATLAEMDKPVLRILAEITRMIAEFEWPASWPGLIPTLVNNIQGQDPNRVHNSLLVIRRLAKRLEYKLPGPDREPLHFLMAKSFPTIQQLIENLKPVLDREVAGASCVHMALKIFYSCTMYKLPKEEAQLDFAYWTNCLGYFVDRPVPAPGSCPCPEPQEEPLREKWPYWSIKKWATKIIVQMIQRYGNPKYVAEENIPFAKHFRAVTSVELLGPVMNTLATKSKGGYLTNIVTKNCLFYLHNSLEMAPTYKHIKPHIEFVLYHVIYPNLFLPPGDVELLEDDPIEFIRRVHSPSMEFVDVRTSTITLLESMVKFREKDCLSLMLSFVQSRLEEYAAATGQAKAALHGHKDASLMTIGAIANTLIKSPQYKPTIEPFMVNHVLPDMQSPSTVVRYRCMWVIEWFVQLEWSQLSPSTLQGLMEGILTNFKHSSLAIQTAAAGALRVFISDDGCKSMLEPIIVDVISEYFRIMEEAETDTILSSLEVLIERFPEQIASMAPMVVQKLVTAFAGYAKTAENDDDEASFSASCCLETLDGLLTRFIETPGTLAAVEGIMLPCIITIIRSERYFEFLDNGLDFLNIFTCCKVDLQSDLLWSCCGTVLEILNGWAMDYVQEGSTALCNYMSMDISRFVRSSTPGGVPYVQLLYKVCERNILYDNSSSEVSGHSAALLLRHFFSQSAQSLPRSERHLIEGMIWPTFAIVASKITARDFADADAEEVLKHQTSAGQDGQVYQPDQPSLYTLLCELGLAVTFYDAPSLMAKAMHCEQNTALTGAFFERLFQACEEIQTFSGSRLLVLALTELIKLDPATQLVTYLRNQIQPMFFQLVAELTLCYEGRHDLLVPEIEDHPRRSMYYDEEDEYMHGWVDSDEEDRDIDDEDAEFDEDDLEEEEEEEDDGTGIHSKKGLAAAKARGGIPAGGFDEDQDYDAHAAGDAEFYAMLEKEEDPDYEALKAKGLKYSNGEPEMASYDHLGTLDHACSLDYLDVAAHFIESANAMEGTRPGLIQSMAAQLDDVQSKKFAIIAAAVNQRRSASQIEDPMLRCQALESTRASKPPADPMGQ